MSAQVAADLRAAAYVLRRDGWTQGELRDYDAGGWCALGAIREAAPYPRRSESLILLHARLGDSVVRWNDAPGRTAAEVIAALEAAADAAEAHS